MILTNARLIDPEQGTYIDDINRSVIQKQVEMGVAVRMAIMDLLGRTCEPNRRRFMSDLLEEFEETYQPADMRPFQEWDRFLEPGETMLWEGFEDLTTYMEKRLKSNRHAAILFLALGLVSLFSQQIVASLFLGLGMIVFLFSKTFVNWDKTIFAYGISDRHVFVHERNRRDRCMRIDFDRIQQILVKEGPPDQVYFGRKRLKEDQKEPSRFGGVVESIPQEPPYMGKNFLGAVLYGPIGFYNVLDGHNVAKRIKNAKGNAT